MNATGARTVIYEVLDDRFRPCSSGDQQLESLYQGCRWAEGPLYIPAGRYLLWSDIPNDRLLRWDETTGTVGVFRSPAGHPNGNAMDRRGRLITCEQGNRRITRTEHDGSITVLAEDYDGRRAEQPERRDGQFRRHNLLLRPGLRHHQRLRGSPGGQRDRGLQRLSHRAGHRQADAGRGWVRRAERPGAVRRPAAPVRVGQQGRPHPCVHRRRQRKTLRRPRARTATSTTSASTTRDGCGPPPVKTGCTATTPTARSSARSGCRKSWPTLRSAVRNETACSSPRTPRCTPSSCPSPARGYPVTDNGGTRRDSPTRREAKRQGAAHQSRDVRGNKRTGGASIRIRTALGPEITPRRPSIAG